MDSEALKRRKEMLDFVANRADPETTRRIVGELADPDSFASKFIEGLRGEAEHLFDQVDWQRLILEEDAPVNESLETGEPSPAAESVAVDRWRLLRPWRIPVLRPAMILLVVLTISGVGGAVGHYLAANWTRAQLEEWATRAMRLEQGWKVGPVENIEDQLDRKRGWPVILVKPAETREPWYVQPVVGQVKEGRFTAQVYFGDSKTEPGTRFYVLILVAENRQEAEKIEPGTSIPVDKPLPELPWVKLVTVMR